MNPKISLAPEQKLHVILRIESGCLGPEGSKHIESYCHYAQHELENLDADFVRWEVLPRYDKDLPETEYKALSKRISQQQAQKYLRMFGKELDDFEGHVHDRLTRLIDAYLGR